MTVVDMEVQEIQLAPEEAQIGIEIRVVGYVIL
jgi:hypothetical protein